MSIRDDYPNIEFKNQRERSIAAHYLREKKKAWNDWHTNPDLIAELRYHMRLDKLFSELRTKYGLLPVPYKNLEDQFRKINQYEIEKEISKYRHGLNYKQMLLFDGLSLIKPNNSISCVLPKIASTKKKLSALQISKRNARTNTPLLIKEVRHSTHYFLGCYEVNSPNMNSTGFSNLVTWTSNTLMPFSFSATRRRAQGKV